MWYTSLCIWWWVDSQLSGQNAISVHLPHTDWITLVVSDMVCNSINYWANSSSKMCYQIVIHVSGPSCTHLGLNCRMTEAWGFAKSYIYLSMLWTFASRWYLQNLAWFINMNPGRASMDCCDTLCQFSDHQCWMDICYKNDCSLRANQFNVFKTVIL